MKKITLSLIVGLLFLIHISLSSAATINCGVDPTTADARCFANNVNSASQTTWCAGALGGPVPDNDAAAVGANCDTIAENPGQPHAGLKGCFRQETNLPYCNDGNGVLILDMGANEEIINANSGSDGWDFAIEEGGSPEPFEAYVSNTGLSWIDVGNGCDVRVGQYDLFYIPGADNAKYRFVKITANGNIPRCDGSIQGSAQYYGADIGLVMGRVINDPNTPPSLNNIPDPAPYPMNAGFQNNIIDLFPYASDSQDTDIQLSFSIVSSSNPSVATCAIDSDRYVDCTIGSTVGYTDITVKVTDTSGATDTDVFRITTFATNNAVCISNTIPSTFIVGETKTISVTIRNTGSTSWTKAAGYRLGSANPLNNVVWGPYRVDLLDTTTVTPNSEYTFTFDVTAPSTPGSYSNQWQMVQEAVEWIGGICGPSAVSVVSNTPPVIDTIPPYTIPAKYPGSFDVFDVDTYAHDAEDPDSMLVYTLNQISGSQYVTCALKQVIASHYSLVTCAPSTTFCGTGNAQFTVQATDRYSAVSNVQMFTVAVTNIVPPNPTICPPYCPGSDDDSDTVNNYCDQCPSTTCTEVNPTNGCPNCDNPSCRPTDPTCVCSSCDACGGGVWNVCDPYECTEQCGGQPCYFVDTSGGLGIGNCNSCTTIPSCSQYSSQELCTSDPCGKNNCYWDIPSGTCKASVCGNEIVDPNELCDFKGLTPIFKPEFDSCQKAGYDAGTLGCEQSTCFLDVNQCRDIGCGDGNIDGIEQCDFVKSFSEKLSQIAYPSTPPGRIIVATGDVDGDGKKEIITAGATNLKIRVFLSNGTLLSEFNPYDTDIPVDSSTYVTAGDILGNKQDQIIVSYKTGTSILLKVFKNQGTTTPSFTLLTSYKSLNVEEGGWRLATADIDNFPTKEIIVGQAGGVVTSSPNVVTAFHLVNPFILIDGIQPFAFTNTFSTGSGVFVAGGDVDGDGKDEVIVSQDDGGTDQIAVYKYNITSGTNLDLISSRTTFSDTNGVRVAAGDIDNDGRVEIIVEGGVTGSRYFRIYRLLANGIQWIETKALLAATGRFITAGDVDGDTIDEIVSGDGSGGTNSFHIYESLQSTYLPQYNDCFDFNFDGGTVACDPSTCLTDTSGCSTICGNGEASGNEICDGSDFRGRTCSDYDTFTGGTLTCTNCDVSTTSCTRSATCGDGIIDPGEQCDFDPITQDIIFGPANSCDIVSGYTGGELSCYSPGNAHQCLLDVSNCIGLQPGVCGDGVINEGEQCDGTNLDGMDCSSFDTFTTGQLTCTNDCFINTANCVRPVSCHDGIIDPGEECDFNDYTGDPIFGSGTDSCTDFGYDTGNLICTQNCQISLDNCGSCSIAADGCCTGNQGDGCDPDCTPIADPDCSSCSTSSGNCCVDNADSICDNDCPPGKDPDCQSTCQSTNDGCCSNALDGECDPNCDEGVDPDCPPCTNAPGDCCWEEQDYVCDPDCVPGIDPDCHQCQNTPDDCCLPINDSICDPNCPQGYDPNCGNCTPQVGDCCDYSVDGICDLDCPGGQNPVDPDCSSHVCDIGQTLCSDGQCCSNCYTCDDGYAGCNFNGLCESDEGCTCSDCGGEQDSCVDGLLCDYLTGQCVDGTPCPIGTRLCADGTCKSDCGGQNIGCINVSDGGTSGCDPGESCDCQDCDGKQDSCAPGLVCDYGAQICVNTPQCPVGSPNCPSGCPVGTLLCPDGSCKSDCNPPIGCLSAPQGTTECDPGESCDCDDCYGKNDTCVYGAICHPTLEVCYKPCEEGTSLCADGKCCTNCDNCGGDLPCVGGIPNSVCDPGESCACQDCDGQQDSCLNGTRCYFPLKTCIGDDCITLGEDPDKNPCLCNVMGIVVNGYNSGVCDSHNESFCYATSYTGGALSAQCCGDDAGNDSWVDFESSTTVQDVLVANTCINGKWYIRKNATITTYDVKTTE